MSRVIEVVKRAGGAASAAASAGRATQEADRAEAAATAVVDGVLADLGITATATELNKLDGVTPTGAALLLAAHAAAARATLGAEPITSNTAGVGYRAPISASAGNILYLPSGGLWEYYWQGETVATGVAIYQGAGVAAGGTAIAGPYAGVHILGWAKKLS